MNTPAARPWVANRFRRPHGRAAGGRASGHTAIELHRTMPGYAPTPLLSLPSLAAENGVGHVLVKDESMRLGLPAFKILGAAWAVYRTLVDRCGLSAPPGIDELGQAVSALDRTYTLVAATDGNHGRAVARMARRLGLSARILLPSSVSAHAVDEVHAEGAHVEVHDLSYDDTVAAASRLADQHGSYLLVQDTAWPGYERVPRWIIDGYSTLFTEADVQVADLGLTIDVVLVPAGVGSLAHAAVLHARGRKRNVVAVEPEVAACIGRSLDTGEPTPVETGSTSMAGLNCGTPSSLSFPDLLSDLAGAIAVTEEGAARAAVDLRRLGVDSGPCGAATLAGLRVLTADETRRHEAGLGPSATVLLLSTEGSAASRGAAQMIDSSDEACRSPRTWQEMPVRRWTPT